MGEKKDQNFIPNPNLLSCYHENIGKGGSEMNQSIDKGEETQGTKKNTQSRKYEVYVDDNFHYMDESERYKLGEFETCEEAVAACKKIVDEFLEQGYTKGVSFKELYEGYIGFGEDPFIVSGDKNAFSQLGTMRGNAAKSFAVKKNK